MMDTTKEAREKALQTTATGVPSLPQTAPLALRGRCPGCGGRHLLATGGAIKRCLDLMASLERDGALVAGPGGAPDPGYATAPLFGEERGKMFGVLEGIDPTGRTVVLRAFSGQFNGLWQVPGWAPPLFSVTAWHALSASREPEIKKLTARIARTGLSHGPLRALKERRRRLSRTLMRQFHSLYTIGNFRGETAPLSAFFPGSPAPPTGAGDCCAPKLLALAHQRDILPTGLAEFYWGRSNRSGSRHHGRFYPACREKCGPLIGFMLCGLEERRRRRAGRP